MIDLKGSKLLVVDDDPVNVAMIAGFLAAEQYVLTQIDSGERALELYESVKPDLILLDVRFPGISGFETCRELRRRHGAATAPVIFITAAQTIDDVVAGFAAGGVDYVQKPVSQKELLARIRTHLANRLLFQQLEEANARKNQLLGMAAHELRNPLSSVRGLSELLREGTMGSLTPDQLDVVTIIRDASHNMLGLVNELLDVAVIEAGELKVSLENCDLSELLEKTVHLSNIEAARKNSTILYQRNGDAPIVMKVDVAKIRQVLDNLLSNAAKYSPPGAKITVGLKTEGDRCVISVRDQGPGIPENESHRLFKDFSTLSVKTTAGEKSTGLGLAICRRIVEAHHGIITVENLPTGGCEFSVSLPRT